MGKSVPIIETERLVIRPLELVDAPQLQEVLGDPEVMRFSITGVCTLDGTRQFIERAISSYEETELGRWAVVERISSAVIGFCGLSPQTVEGVEHIEIGYRLARRFWGKGLATEAASRVLAFGFEQLALEAVIAIIEPANVASVRVAEKIGLSNVAEARYHDFDVRIYRKTLSEWTRERHEASAERDGHESA
jgi:ribosomal-protein-alanine N-acetyltransferase